MRKKIPFAILFALSVCNPAFPQQGANNTTSAKAKAECKFSDEESITVDYFSPPAAGRKIFGGLVPYGKVWRTGDEPTTFVTDEDLVALKGTNIPAGNYTIVMVPNPGKWTLIINKNTVYESGELVRVPMSVKKVSAPVEDLTISFDSAAGSCTMRVSWENTQASLEFAKRNTDLPLRSVDAVRPQK
ncbi:MAG TPA: DUF2911 domain-containing protein [Candidatus Sulfotelmatobacter sp.]|jgi:hypothetical protein|nr:DUF2911 domain-containing protein [Candidatus Sulfotelmatobacter sp.]